MSAEAGEVDVNQPIVDPVQHLEWVLESCTVQWLSSGCSPKHSNPVIVLFLIVAVEDL